MSTKNSVKMLSQKEAQEIDNQLMNESIYGFSVNELMENAGMSVAHTIVDAYKPFTQFKRVLIIVGPGNNGGDGLVAARHLKHFGYDVTLLIPKESSKQLFKNLTLQCKTLDIPIRKQLDKGELTKKDSNGNTAYDVIVDGIFGFSFKGDSIRAPFDEVLKQLQSTSIPILSIDIPSGWNVENGDEHGLGFNPDCLISLTAPKKCAQYLKKGTKHYIGGRFVPKKMENEFQLNLPKYKGTDIIVNITNSEN